MESAALEERICRLERFLCGASSCADVSKPEITDKLIGRLVTDSNRLSDTIKQREKLRVLISQINDHCKDDDILNNKIVDEISLSTESQVEVILASTNHLESQLDLLSNVDFDSTKLLDSEHIRNAPDLTPKLHQLSILQSNQIEVVKKHNLQVSDLINRYNTLIISISNQFAAWDCVLTTLEDTTIVQPPSDEFITE